MRQVLSTAIVAVIVSLLTLTVAGAMAQSRPAEEAITPSVVRAKSADKVDGKHAVRFTNRSGRRAGKLVATNGRGLLPSNIVQPLWRLIRNKPAVLADGQVGWSEVAGMPGGFADNVDDSIRNTYFAGGKVFTVADTLVHAEWEVPSPNVLVTVEPVTTGPSLSAGDVWIRMSTEGTWRARWRITNHSYASQGNAQYRVRFVDFGTGPNGPTTADVRAARSLQPGNIKRRK